MASTFGTDKGGRVPSNVSVTGTATLLIASGGRKSVTFQNQGSVDVYLGASGVTTSGATAGYKLAAGASITDTGSNDAWYGITAGTTANVHVIAII